MTKQNRDAIRLGLCGGALIGMAIDFERMAGLIFLLLFLAGLTYLVKIKPDKPIRASINDIIPSDAEPIPFVETIHRPITLPEE